MKSRSLEWGMLQRFLKYSYKSVDLGVFSFYGSVLISVGNVSALWNYYWYVGFLFEDWDGKRLIFMVIIVHRWSLFANRESFGTSYN